MPRCFGDWSVRITRSGHVCEVEAECSVCNRSGMSERLPLQSLGPELTVEHAPTRVPRSVVIAPPQRRRLTSNCHLGKGDKRQTHSTPKDGRAPTRLKPLQLEVGHAAYDIDHHTWRNCHAVDWDRGVIDVPDGVVAICNPSILLRGRR